jgi:hypothetical protein
MATGAEVAAFARVPDQKFMTTLSTFDPCETAVKVSAIQIAMDDIYCIWSPESMTRGITIIPDLFEFFEMRFNALVVSA